MKRDSCWFNFTTGHYTENTALNVTKMVFGVSYKQRVPSTNYAKYNAPAAGYFPSLVTRQNAAFSCSIRHVIFLKLNCA